jgi:hypothetical protein
MDCRLATTTMRAGAIDELLSPPPPAPRPYNTQYLRGAVAGAYGHRQALEAGTRGWGRVAYGGEWGRVAYGGEHTTEGTYQGTSLHAQGTPCMCLIACTRHAVHVPHLHI